MSAALAEPPALLTKSSYELPRISPRRRWWLALFLVWASAAIYVGGRINRGWIPSDEGVLGQQAERVLTGEMPHRDYDEIYTGGLSAFDAAVFRTAGVRLVNLRWALFAVFLLWVPVIFWVATRFAGLSVAAFVTLLCVVWSVPTYPAAMPSWYNLFFASFGTAALLRYIETSRSRWLFVAGLAGGLSLLVKIVGLYYIAAALLFIAWEESRETRGGGGATGGKSARGYAILMTSALTLFVFVLFGLIRDLPGHSRFLHFVAPGASLALVLGVIQWQTSSYATSSDRLRRLARLIAPFALGVALPVLLFLVPYLVSGAGQALWRGVFVNPLKRMTFARLPPVPFDTIGMAAIWLLVLIPPLRTHRLPAGGRRVVALILGLLGGMLAFSNVHGGRLYVDGWLMIRYLAPCTVAAGLLLLIYRRARGSLAESRQSQLWLLICMVALCSLVQVPYAGGDYAAYTAPLAILALLAMVVSRASGVGWRVPMAGGFFFVFAVACVNPGRLSALGTYNPSDMWPTEVFAIPRTGLLVGPRSADVYSRVVTAVRAHSQAGGYVYAAPDCPEIYYLTGLKNPTRTLFDFLDEPAGRTARILRLIDSLRVTAVAQNTRPYYSPPMDSALAAGLRARFPDSIVVDKFIVRWGPGH